MSSSAAPASASASADDYGLPAADDLPAWEGVLRPATGRLLLCKAAAAARGGLSRRPHPTLVPVTVWVHCGLHYQPRRAPAGPACTPPSPGGMPRLDLPEKHFGFFPLRRDEPGLDPFFSVRFFRAAPSSGEVRGVDGLWVVELVAAADVGRPLRFCAASKPDAAAWATQLRMRAAPLTVVWSRHGGVPVSSSGVGTGGAGRGADGPGRLGAVAALHGGAQHVLANDVLAGVAGVAAELTQPQAHNLAVAAGPLLGVAFGALGFALRLFAALRSAFGAAVGVLDDLDDLSRRLRLYVLPSLRDLLDDGPVDMGDLMDELGRLVSGVEVLAGELHHLVRSRRQRTWLACVSTQRGVEVGGDFQARLHCSRESARQLVQLIQLGLGRRNVTETVETRHAVDAAAPLTVAQHAARKGLPPLPPHVFNNWRNPELPAFQLYAAVMTSGSTTCAAVGAHGMGGVGKTLSCLLVAHRVVGEAPGRARFPDGVHWVQLSDKVGDADVKQRVCDLATTLSGQLAVANELPVAVGHLRAALQGKSCLVIVDDVWDDRWAAAFLGAVRSVAGPCLLLSTRRQDIATRTNVSQSVAVDTLRGVAAAGVLMVHAKAGGEEWANKTDKRVQLALDACGGLALALAVMGALVREHGWASAVERVRCERAAVFATSLDVADVVEEYKGSLWACLLASYRALDAGEQLLWRRRFQALCVVRPKEHLPGTALAALWGEREPMVVKGIAQTLRDRSLVTLHGEQADGTLCLSMHDLVIEFLAGPLVMGQEQREGVHLRMVAKYCERSGVGDAKSPTSATSPYERMRVRALWQLPSDGFVERTLPRLLCAGGTRGHAELRILLFDWRFIAWRVKVGGGGCGIYRMDGRAYLKDGVGVSVEVLDCLVNVVESAVAVQDLPLPPRLQQAAWEVAERFASRPHVAGGEAAASLLTYLRDTARLCLDHPAVALYGACRLGLPQEHRVFGCGEVVRSLCRVANSCGDVLLIAGQSDGKLSIWEERSGSRVAALEGHTSSVDCLSALDVGGSNGGGQVLSGSDDGTVRLWEVDDGTCLAVLEGHTSGVSCLAVLGGGGGGDGRRVVSGSSDGSVRVWEVDNGNCHVELEGHQCAVTCLAVLHAGESGGGGRIVSGSANGAVRVWDADGGECVAKLEGHRSRVRCLAVLDGGGSGGWGRVASGSDDGTVRVWRVDGDECVAVLEGHSDSVRCLAVLDGGGSGSGGRMVSGSSDCTVRLWDVENGTCLAVLKGHTSWVRCFAVLDPGGSGVVGRVMSGSSDGTVRVWDADGGTCVAVLEGHATRVRCLAVLDGGESGSWGRVASGSDDGTVRVWQVDDGMLVPGREIHSDSVRCLAVLEGGEDDVGGRMVSGSDDGTVRVWQLDGGKCVAVLKGHSAYVTCLAVLTGNGSGGGGRVASGAWDGTVRVWDVDGGECVAVFEHDVPLVICVALLECRGGWRMVSGSNDCIVRVWDVDGGECVAKLEGHQSHVRCLAVLDGGGSGGWGRVASGSDDGTVRVWRVDGDECVAVLEGHSDSVRCLAVLDGGGSGSGGRMVSGSADLTVRVWETVSYKCVAVLEGHASAVVYLGVLHAGESGCGGRLFSGSDDGTVRVWEADGGECGGECVAELPHLGLPVVAGAAVSPLVGPFTRPAATFFDGVYSWENLRGMCALYDSSGQLRYLPGPPLATALCTVSPGRFAWGTSAGRVFFGRLHS